LKGFTGTGDKGETSLYGGTRVGKDNLRVEAYGAVDELNSQVGMVRASVNDHRIGEILRGVQRDLFVLGGDLATERATGKTPRIEKSHVSNIEKVLEDVHSELRPLKRFILPTGGVAGSGLHVARAVCRRAERRVVALAKAEAVNPEDIRYLNRLSSLLFELARLANKNEGAGEEEWVHE